MKKRGLSLALALVLTIALVPAAMPAQATVNTVTVTTAEELQNAIASNTEITLLGTTYTFGGSWLLIGEVENLTIVGTDGTRLVNNSEDSIVLVLYGSSNVTIKNVFIGHDIPIEWSCGAGVVGIGSSEGVLFENCDIYGCGLYGFSLSESSVHFKDSIIRDCSLNIGAVSNSEVVFDNCVFNNNGYANDPQGNDYRSVISVRPTVGISISNTADSERNTLLTFNNCSFADNNNTFFIAEDSTEYVTLNNCTFEGNTWQVSEIPSDWAIPQVNAAIGANLVPQNLQSRYQATITRAEFAALAVRLYETITGGEITGRVTFADTNDVNAEKAAAVGIAAGVGDGRFAPSANLTREQAAVMLSNLATSIGTPLTEVTATFNDTAEISSWAAKQVGQIQAAGIMSGVGNNTFAPQSPYTREQSIVTIWKMWELLA